MSDEEATVWARVTATKPGDWFDAGSIPLLAQYCRAVVQSDAVAEAVRAVTPFLSTEDGLARYNTLRKIQAALSGELTSLATKMRLSQQARYGTRAAEVANKRAGGRKPWEQQHDVLES